MLDKISILWYSILRKVPTVGICVLQKEVRRMTTKFLSMGFSAMMATVGFGVAGCDGQDYKTVHLGSQRPQVGDNCSTNQLTNAPNGLFCARNQPDEFQLLPQNSTDGTYVGWTNKIFRFARLAANGGNSTLLRWTKQDGTSGSIAMLDYQTLVFPYSDHNSVVRLETDDMSTTLVMSAFALKDGKEIFSSYICTEKNASGGPLCRF